MMLLQFNITAEIVNACREKVKQSYITSPYDRTGASWGNTCLSFLQVYFHIYTVNLRNMWYKWSKLNKPKQCTVMSGIAFYLLSCFLQTQITQRLNQSCHLICVNDTGGCHSSCASFYSDMFFFLAFRSWGCSSGIHWFVYSLCTESIAVLFGCFHPSISALLSQKFPYKVNFLPISFSNQFSLKIQGYGIWYYLQKKDNDFHSENRDMPQRFQIGFILNI